uniref:Soluble scavenger receptor cysteine-rich domain-containing protein SSC5D n=1 Tax=Mola mola TaxID=94237 RepID=A0A3Q3WY76_MOLML
MTKNRKKCILFSLCDGDTTGCHLIFPECDKIRLVGPSRCAGRVEIYHRDSWGTVCDDQWSLANANVVCRELNCGTVLEAKKSAFFGEGKDEIWLDDVQCTGNEPSIFKCTHRPFGENNCGHGEDAGVLFYACLLISFVEHLKVVNGSNRCNGRVEVYHDGRWKRACTDDWGRSEAGVVCREINCGTPVTQTEVIHFGDRPDLDGVKTTCSGNETSISQCKIQDFKESCVDVAIVCSSTYVCGELQTIYSKPIRLKNGTRCSGRVEVFHDGQWGTVCDDKWGMQEATVTCREMNCGNALKVKYKAFFGRGQDQVWLDDIECTGEWGTVCGEAWDVNDATVVCRQLDCGRVHKITLAADYGHGSGQTRIEQIECTGLERTLAQCPKRPFTSKTCNTTSLAGVACTGRGIYKIPKDNTVFFVVTELYECDIFHDVCVVIKPIFFVVS